MFAASAPGMLPEWQELGVPLERSTLLPNPVEIDRIPPPVARRERGPTLRVASVARLYEVKRYDIILDAIAQVAPHTPVELEVMGDGPLRSELQERAARLGIADRVHWLGFVDDPFSRVAKCDAMVLASDHEGGSIVIAEALACGTPVVATDAPFGARFRLDGGRYGRLVPVNSPDAVADALLEIARAPVPGESEIATWRAWAESFAGERIARRFEEIGDTVVERRPAPDRLREW
jgi:glycosyltransferase involved in cell wall biosynthesis